MRRFIQVFCFVGFLISNLPMLRGDTVTESANYSFAYALSSAYTHASARSTDLYPSVAGFDASLGTLTGVKLTLNLSDTTSDLVVNYTNSQSSNIQVRTFATGFVLTTYPGEAYIGNGTASLNSGTVYLINPGSNDLGAFSAATTFNKTLTLTQYNSWLLSGQLPFDLYLSADLGFSSAPGTIVVSGSGSAAGLITMTYTYSPTTVPEPSTTVMLIVGLLAVGLVGRTRARHRRG